MHLRLDFPSSLLNGLVSPLNLNIGIYLECNHLTSQAKMDTGFSIKANLSSNWIDSHIACETRQKCSMETYIYEN